MDEKGLGKRLQKARQSAGLTQQALCQRANLSYSTLTKIERGAIRSPSIFTIQSIAEAVGVSLDELIGGNLASDKGRLRQPVRSRSGINFVYFDVNGCLVHFFHRALTQLAQDCGQPSDVVETAFWHHNNQVCRGELTIDEFNHELANSLGVDNIDWFGYYLAHVEPVTPMHELVNWAHEYYGVGLLTNIMPGLLRRLLNQGLVPNIDYDVIIDSSEAHLLKPEKDIYKLATDRAGRAPQEILLVDDSRLNLMAAEGFGWHVLWFDNYHAAESTQTIQEALQPVLTLPKSTEGSQQSAAVAARLSSAW